MQERNGKILGTLLFFLLILFFSLLVFFPKKSNVKKINMIEITGNKFLSEKDYLKQTMLDDKNSYNDLSLPIIKDRFEKHPYVFTADVELSGNNKVHVIINEKNMIAVLLNGSEQFFISSENQILPFTSNTKFVDLPVITNSKDDVKRFSLIKNDDLTEALKIIDSAKLTDEKLSSGLSEINLRDGGDVILMFSKVAVPVVFGRGDEARKMVYLESLMENWKNSADQFRNTTYIDLRFYGNIYAGTN